MWRRESIGAVSVVVGDVGGASSTHRPTDTNAQWNRHRQHHPAPRRFDSTELADSPLRNEAVKVLPQQLFVQNQDPIKYYSTIFILNLAQLVRELNKAVAGHVALATLLGGTGDGPHLRDELRRARRTAQEAAAAAKSTLLPALLEYVLQIYVNSFLYFCMNGILLGPYLQSLPFLVFR